MEEWAWAELLAQTVEHGFSKVHFYLDQEDPETGENLELDVVDVTFVDNEVKVILA